MYIHINSTYRQKKEFHLYPNIYVPLGGHLRNYIEFIEAGSLKRINNHIKTIWYCELSRNIGSRPVGTIYSTPATTLLTRWALMAMYSALACGHHRLLTEQMLIILSPIRAWNGRPINELAIISRQRQLKSHFAGLINTIFQAAFSNAFSWMKMYTFRSRFHWSLFPRVHLIMFQHWFR